MGVKSIKVFDPSPEEVVCFKVSLIEKITLSPSPLKISKPTKCAYKEPIARNLEASLYCGTVVVSNLYRQTALSMRESIPDKIVRTPYENVPTKVTNQMLFGF